MSEPLNNLISPTSDSDAIAPLSSFAITPSVKKLYKHNRRGSDGTERQFIPVPTAKIFLDT
jgi:hypothetical protein